MATWLDRGGVYAVANLRGGGEYGETWHEGGTKLNKQNVFDDFIAAAEHLIAAGYTNPQKLAIYGRSNGGLLAAATALQRPELFRASLPTVGVLDMLRFNQFTIGWAWESDYGSPQNADEFAALRAYSPLHNIQPGVRYPAMLIPTGDATTVFSRRTVSSTRRRCRPRTRAATRLPDPHRNPRRPRRRQTHHDADRRVDRHAQLPGARAWDAVKRGRAGTRARGHEGTRARGHEGTRARGHEGTRRLGAGDSIASN
jgi:hypothetical protein